MPRNELRLRLRNCGSEAGLFVGARFAVFRLLDNAERRTSDEGIEGHALDRHWPSAFCILPESGVQNRRTLEYEALRRADDAIDDAAFEQLTARTNH